ncbi:carbonic anhydrase [Aquimarina spinulae]|uniref:carbonic anhydrase n=1 Tax=Aquimarina spinulae TaxID=1192023 RepID=UPI000D55D154|nr:carbonic anhydrase family protein [Aquimarina spinulae]
MKNHTIITRLFVYVSFFIAFSFLTSCSKDEIEKKTDNKLQNSGNQQSKKLYPWEYETYNSYLSNYKEEYSNAKKSTVKWSYNGATGPEFWGNLSPDFVLCAEGTSQSPIDISSNCRTSNGYGDYFDDEDGLHFFYKKSTLNVLNNTHTIQFSPKPGSYVKLKGVRYNLAQFHVHASSEHTIDSRFSPLEIHFVHTNSENDKDLLVVGLLVERGRFNRRYNSFWKSSNFPKEGNSILEVTRLINLAHLLPRNKSRYNYSGSLTTPPCSEGVNWNVLTRKIRMSRNQIKAFTRLYSDNFRPVQETNDRDIVLVPDYFFYY